MMSAAPSRCCGEDGRNEFRFALAGSADPNESGLRWVGLSLIPNAQHTIGHARDAPATWLKIAPATPLAPEAATSWRPRPGPQRLWYSIRPRLYASSIAVRWPSRWAGNTGTRTTKRLTQKAKEHRLERSGRLPRLQLFQGSVGASLGSRLRVDNVIERGAISGGR
jgi:hypothetical protein